MPEVSVGRLLSEKLHTEGEKKTKRKRIIKI